MSRHIAKEAITHHDWVYRWQRILDAAGVPRSSGMERRERQLKRLRSVADTVVESAAGIKTSI
jgi:hypothetical protein